MRLPRPRKKDLERARERGESLARALGMTARTDPELPTHMHVEGEHEGRRVHITLGSPRMARGLLRSELVHFMTFTVEGPTWLPPGAQARPAARSVWEWRDGLPGETPNLRTKSGAGYVLLPAELVPELGARVAEAVEGLPHAGWIHATATGLELRVGDLEEGDDPRAVARAVLGWRGFRAPSSPWLNGDGALARASGLRR